MAQQNAGYLDLGGVHVPVSSVLFTIAALVCVALWQLDEKYYYKMLVASVEHAESLEPMIKHATGDLISGLALTEHITSKVSRIRAQAIARWFYGGPFVISAALVLLSFAYHGGAAVQSQVTPAPVTSQNAPPPSPEIHPAD